MSVASIVEQCGLSERAVESARAGTPPSKKRSRDRLASIAGAHARERLREQDIKPQRRDLAVCAIYNDERDNLGTRLCRARDCAQPLTGRQKEWCSEACRKRATRAANARPAPRGQGSGQTGRAAKQNRRLDRAVIVCDSEQQAM